MRTSRSSTTVMTANDECKTERKWRFLSFNWTYSSKLCFLKKLTQFFLSVNLCEDHGHTCQWPSGQKARLTKSGKRIIDCNSSNYVPFVVSCTSASSSSTTFSPTSVSSSLDSVFDVNRYTEKSGSTSGELRGDPLCESQTEKEIPRMNCLIGRMDGIAAVTLWIWWLKSFIPYRTKQKDPSTPTSFQLTLTTFHPAQCILFPVLCCMCLRTMKWESK